MIDEPGLMVVEYSDRPRNRAVLLAQSLAALDEWKIEIDAAMAEARAIRDYAHRRQLILKAEALLIEWQRRRKSLLDCMGAA